MPRTKSFPLILLLAACLLALAAVPAWAQSAPPAPTRGEQALSDCMTAQWTVNSNNLFQVSFLNSGTSLAMTSLGPGLPTPRSFTVGFWACKTKVTLTYKPASGSTPHQVLINSVSTSMDQAPTNYNGVLAAWTTP